MLADIQACLSLIKSIYDVYEEISSNQKAARRLSERVFIFKTFFEDLKNKLKIDSSTATIPESLRLSIESNKSLLSEILQYILKLKGQNGFFGSVKRMVINISFRKQIKDDLDDLNERLNSSISILMPSMAINFEEERKKDSDAFSTQMDSLIEEVMKELFGLKGKSSDIQFYLKEMKFNLMPQILNLLKK
jgi:hypothetical protein